MQGFLFKKLKDWFYIHFCISLTKKLKKYIDISIFPGKTEKLVYQSLADAGLPNEKGMSIELDQFTFEIFYRIYQTICPR